MVDNYIAVMLHWENNPASTNALAVDYSEGLENTALYKFPGETFGIFSELFGDGAPNMSFLIRVNTLDNGNPITNTETLSYNVYLGLANEFPDISNWDLLNSSPLTDISLLDNYSQNVDPNEIYRYAVETIYTEGNSEVTFSNEISGGLLDIEELLANNSGILLYPIPSNDIITIKFESFIGLNTSIGMFDILGKRVDVIDTSEIHHGLITKNISNLENGIYFLKFNIDGVIINKKFIVNH